LAAFPAASILLGLRRVSQCDKCGRAGRYRVDRLIERYGIDAKSFDWSDEITADCPRKQAANLNDVCGARCPDADSDDVARANQDDGARWSEMMSPG
jgi:hypothetical protein